MFIHFVRLQWKSFFRSASLGKSIGLKILLGFFAVYFSVSALLFGIGLYPLLEKLYPQFAPLTIANRFIIIGLLSDLLLRFFMQTLPVIDIKPLMVVPISKKKIIHYVLLKSLFSFYNFLPLLIIIPFGITCIVYGNYNLLSMLGWIFSVYSLILCVNYTNFLIKKKFADRFVLLLPFIVVGILFAVLEYFEVFEISIFIGQQFNILLMYPVLLIIPISLLIATYYWNYSTLKRKFYLDASVKIKTKARSTTALNWTRRFGELSLFLQQDIKLIWRNKRPKTTIWLALILLGYGMIFYPNETYHTQMPAMFVFVGIFITGIFMINFGQFIPAWDSDHYSMIMAQHIPLRKYLAAKALLLSFSIIVLFLLSTPYVYFGWRIVVLNLACALYNLGINTPVILYAGAFNRKRIDLKKSPFMNYQGTGATQWLIGIPLLLIPLIIWYLFYKLIGFEAATVSLGVMGLTGLLLRNSIMHKIVRAYQKNKYAMLNGFRHKVE